MNSNNEEIASENNQKFKLDKKYCFWYRISEEALLFSKFVDSEEYENQVKKIAEFDTVNKTLINFKFIDGRFLGNISAFTKA